MGATGIFTMLDHGGEKSPFKFSAGDITAVSLPGFLTQFGALRTAIEGLTVGVVTTEQWVGDRTLLSSVNPTSGLAQRENKWLIRYRGDTSSEIYRAELGTADLTLLDAQPGEFLDLTDAAPAAFVTAFEAIARSPESDLETVTVVSIQFVGRNT